MAKPYTTSPANASMAVTVTESLFPIRSVKGTLSGSSATIATLIAHTIPVTAGGILIIPDQDTQIAFGSVAGATNAVLKADLPVYFYGTKTVLDSIQLNATGTVNIILYGDITALDDEYQSSSSSSSSTSSSSESSSSSTSSSTSSESSESSSSDSSESSSESSGGYSESSSESSGGYSESSESSSSSSGI
jgi:hypothetical protein